MMRKIKPSPIMDLKQGNIVITTDGTILADGLSIRDTDIKFLKNNLPGTSNANVEGSLEESFSTVYRYNNLNKLAILFEDGSSCEAPGKVDKTWMSLNGMLRYLGSYDNRIPFVYTVKSGIYAGRKLLSHPNGIYDITDPDHPSIVVPRVVGDPTTTTISGTTTKTSNLFRVLDDDATGFELLTYNITGGVRVNTSTLSVHPQVRTTEDFTRPFNRSLNAVSLPVVYRPDKKVGFYLDYGVDNSGQYNTRNELSHLAAYLNENKGITLIPRAVLGNKTVAGTKFVLSDFISQGSINNTPFTGTNGLSTGGTGWGLFTHEVKRYNPIVRSVTYEENRTDIFLVSPESDVGPFASAYINNLRVSRNVFNHATESFTEIPMLVRTLEGNAVARFNDKIVDIGDSWSGTNLYIQRANVNYGGTNVAWAYEAHSVISITKTYGNETYLIVIVCPTNESQFRSVHNYYPSNTVQYTLRLDKENLGVCYLVGHHIMPGFFGEFNVGLSSFCSDIDYDNLYFITHKDVRQVTYSETEHRFEMAPLVFDVDAYALHVSQNNTITMIDKDNKLYQVRSSLSNVVEVDFENPYLVYEEIPRDTFLIVNVRNYKGDKIERSVRLILDGPAIFRDNGSRQINVTTDFIEDTRIAITLTGYGNVYVTPAEIQE